MAKTTNYGIPLIDEGAQDWKTPFDQILEAVDRTLAVNQKPSTTSLKWGDVTNGLYLESNALGLQSYGPLNMGGNQVQNLVLHTVSQLPASGTAGQILYNQSNGIPYVYASGSWKPIGLNLSAGSPASAFADLGLVTRSEWGNNKGSVLAKGDGTSLVSISPASTGQVLGFKANGATQELAFSSIGTWVGVGLTKGKIWAGSGTDTAVAMDAPTSDQLLVGDPTTSTGWKFSKVADILPADDYSSASRHYANRYLG